MIVSFGFFKYKKFIGGETILNKKLSILIIMLILLLCVCFISSVSAAKEIEIDNWAESDVTSLFNGNIVNSVQIEDGDSITFNTANKDTYKNLSLTLKNSVSIYGNGVIFSRDTMSGNGITINNNSQILITGITFINYSTGIYKNNPTMVNDITIDNCKFYNVSNPINILAISSSSITNNQLSNEGTGVGIRVSDSLSVLVLNNTIIKGLHIGIYFLNTKDSFIGFNNLSYDNINNPAIIANPGNSYGLLISNSQGISVYSNNVSDFYESIDIASSSNNACVYNNTVNHCGWGIKFSSAINGYAYNNTVKNCYNIQSKGTGTGLCIINNADNITIENNTISNNVREGIQVKNSSNIFLKNNTIHDNSMIGINIEANVPNVEILKNTIYNNNVGINFLANSNYIISGNRIYNCKNHGITALGGLLGTTAQACDGFEISNNYIYSNGGSGINLASTSNKNFNISNNFIYNNSVNGISLAGNNHTIRNNEIYANKQNGINLGTSSSRSQNNTIKDNIIFNNSYAGMIAYINYNNLSNNKIFNNSREGMAITGNYNNIVNSEIYGNSRDGLVISGNFNNILGGSIYDNKYNGINISGNYSNISSIAIYNNVFNGINVIANWTTINNTEIYENLRNGVLFDSKGHDNLLTESNITLNGINGVLMNGVNDTVQSSNILKNIISGINVTGKDNEVVYNRIYQNGIGMYHTGTNTIANFNWWGINNITNQYEDFGENLNLSTWYVLHLSGNDLNTTSNTSKYCNIGEIVNLTYSLETNDYSPHTPNLLPYFEVSVLSSLTHVVIADIRDYTISITVSADVYSNLDSPLEGHVLHYIRALCDDEDIILDLLMKKSENIPDTNGNDENSNNESNNEFNNESNSDSNQDSNKDSNNDSNSDFNSDSNQDSNQDSNKDSNKDSIYDSNGDSNQDSNNTIDSNKINNEIKRYSITYTANASMKNTGMPIMQIVVLLILTIVRVNVRRGL